MCSCNVCVLASAAPASNDARLESIEIVHELPLVQCVHSSVWPIGHGRQVSDDNLYRTEEAIIPRVMS